MEERTVGSAAALAWAFEQSGIDPVSKLALLTMAAGCGTNVVPITQRLIDQSGIEGGSGELSFFTALLDLQDAGLVRLHVELLMPE